MVCFKCKFKCVIAEVLLWLRAIIKWHGATIKVISYSSTFSAMTTVSQTIPHLLIHYYKQLTA